LAGALLLKDVIDAYRDLRDESRPIGDTSNEHYMLRHLSECLGDKRAGSLSPQDLVDFATMRKEEGADPYTINMEISKLGTAMRYAGAVLKVALPGAVGQARPLLNHLGLIGAGGKRERRTNDGELPRIVKHLLEHYGARYADAVDFAVRTVMRRGEVCSIVWPDVDEKKRLVTIRNPKHPRKKIGNDEWIPLLGGALSLLQRQE
jgi:integrase